MAAAGLAAAGHICCSRCAARRCAAAACEHTIAAHSNSTAGWKLTGTTPGATAARARQLQAIIGTVMLPCDSCCSCCCCRSGCCRGMPSGCCRDYWWAHDCCCRMACAGRWALWSGQCCCLLCHREGGRRNCRRCLAAASMLMVHRPCCPCRRRPSHRGTGQPCCGCGPCDDPVGPPWEACCCSRGLGCCCCWCRSCCIHCRCCVRGFASSCWSSCCVLGLLLGCAAALLCLREVLELAWVGHNALQERVSSLL
jgi:hypothetical protein